MIKKEMFKSPKYIILLAMAVDVILILIGTVWFHNNYLHLELSALLVLSLLLGPFAVLGFTITEVLYWVMFLGMNDPLTILLSGSALLILGIYPWKLWYSLNYKKNYEIPNMNSFYSLIKIIVIFFVMILQTNLFAGQIFNRTINLNIESYYSMFVLGLMLLLVGMGIFGRLNIPTYAPVNLKRLMPDIFYDIALLLSMGLCIITLNHPSYAWFFIILLLATVFLIKPFGEEVFKIDSTQKISMFYKVFISIFLIMIIIPSFILFSLKMSGFYASSFAFEFFNYLVMISWFFVVILLPLIIYMLFLEKQVINPIDQLSKFLRDEITNDNLKDLVSNLGSISVNNEIKSLSESMINMEQELVVYTDNLVEVTKEKERYETELKLAREIQFSMIPTDFEKFHDDNNIGIWGYMKAAQDVGGDFYDYFRIDEENIGFVMGDVSGKGVPTALIMVKAMTLIRDYATYYDDISDVLHEVNNELFKDNVEELFVSCWLGKLNVKTNELAYVNAGHKQPLIRQDGGDFEFMDTELGSLLAKMQDMHYDKHVIHLKPDDTLFLYTDGISASDYDGTRGFYDRDTLRRLLNQNKDMELNAIIKSFEDEIEEFCKDHELFDDSTMLIIKIN